MQTKEHFHTGHIVHEGQRSLLQSDSADVTVVSTPLELIEAVEKAATHIEIREHLDLTETLPRDNEPPLAILTDNNSDTKDFGFSIRVRIRSTGCCPIHAYTSVRQPASLERGPL